ncbi:hypothetical protein HK104_000192 [Borealophlyctis nickersoniae]|nr:hypothetical protein HK104_000192 [Borealophlyctis nickersoniae]
MDTAAIATLLERADLLPAPADVPADTFLPLFTDTAALLSTFPAEASAETAREAEPLVALLDKWTLARTLDILADACTQGTVDPYLTASAFFDAVRVKSLLKKSADMIEIVGRGLSMLDPKNVWRSWVMDHPETIGEDVDNVLGRAIPRGTQLAGQKATLHAAVGRMTQALSKAVYLNPVPLPYTQHNGGNLRHALHIQRCSIAIYERVRACVAVPADARINEQELRDLYANAAEEAIKLDETDLAVELGTKLVTIHEVAIAEAVMECRDEATSVVSRGHVDPLGHFWAQELLGRALNRFGDAEGSLCANKRALELLEVEWPWEEERAKTSFTAPADIRKAIYARMMYASRSLGHPARESLEFARSAIAIMREMDEADPDAPANHDDARLLYGAGSIAYAYALELAGGVAHASSPPVAVAHLIQKGGPDVKSLLDEAVGYLEEGLGKAELGDVEGGKRSIALQPKQKI